VRRSGLLVVALVALSVGCTGDDDDGDTSSTTTEAPTTTTAVETTTTTAAPDPFTVPSDPADIDEAYVEAVLTELERINGDALRLAVSEGLSPQITELIRSIYEPTRAATEFDLLVDASIGGFPGVRVDPGDAVPSVDEILSASASCIGVDTHFDFTAVSGASNDPLPLRIELRQQAAGVPTNPTSWVYTVKSVNDGVEEVASPCVGT